MVPAPSVKVPRVSTYSGYRHVTSSFAYGAFTLSGWLSQNHSATLGKSIPRSEPRGARTPVWALPVSLAATPGIDVSFSSSGYLDVSVHRVPLHTYLLLPEAFRSLSRLSSALSAKASTLRSFMHNQLEGSRGNGFLPHMYSVTCVGSGQFFTLFSSKCCNSYNSFLFITITSDVLIFSSISYMRFSRYIAKQIFYALEACFHKL